jgi:hypothetical protein
MNTRYATGFAATAILLVAVTLTAVTATSGVFAQTEDAEDTSDDSTNQIDEESSDIVEDTEDQDEPGEDILETEDDSESAEEEVEYTSSFRTEDCTFSATGSNPYFTLEPNYRQVLVGNESGAAVEQTITVLNETREVNGTETRVVEERETEDGELLEISRNFFAICDETNSVFYFGEEVDDYENGAIWVMEAHGLQVRITIRLA